MVKQRSIVSRALGRRTGIRAPWVASPGVIMRATNSYRPLDGSYIGRFAAEGTTTTDTLSQTVTLPTGCTTHRFQYSLAIDSNELSLFTARDRLILQVLDTAGQCPGDAASMEQPERDH
jgi:hypothetical protein